MAWTSPRTWVAGEKPTAATMNTHIRDNFNAIGAAWTSYTPTLTGITLGNGTLTAGYIQAGKLVHYRIELTLGSTSSVTTTVQFGLPFAPVAAVLTHHPMGTATLLDSSAPAVAARFVTYNSSSNVLLRDQAGAAVTNVAPWTWATSDTMQLSGTYESA